MMKQFYITGMRNWLEEADAKYIATTQFAVARRMPFDSIKWSVVFLGPTPRHRDQIALDLTEEEFKDLNARDRYGRKV